MDRIPAHTESMRFTDPQLQQKIVSPDYVDLVAIVIRQIVELSYTHLKLPARSARYLSTRFAGYINMTAPRIQRAGRVS